MIFDTTPKTIDHRKMSLIVLFVVIFIGITSNTYAQESKYKALFLYKFSEYIEWPTAQDKVKVGVIGDSDVYSELIKFSQARADLEVIRLKSPGESSKCNIVFAARSGSDISSYISAIQKNSILIVSEEKSGMAKGTDIGFYMQDSKLRFVIDKKNLESKKLKPSTKLLSLGEVI